MNLAACIQINSIDNISRNIEQAQLYLQKAAEQGARLALLPEMFISLNAKHYAAIASDKTYLTLLSAWAKKYHLWLVAGAVPQPSPDGRMYSRSEEHTSELQSRPHLVCRLLLEKKKKKKKTHKKKKEEKNI